MWVCKAGLPDGTVCETSNFDSSASCSNCGAVMQVVETPEFQSAEGALGEKLMSGMHSAAQFSRDKARDYAPMAKEVARQARVKAGEVALHSRIATRTGVHPFTVVAICTALLIASISLPVALGWPIELVISNRIDRRVSSQGYAPAAALTPPTDPAALDPTIGGATRDSMTPGLNLSPAGNAGSAVSQAADRARIEGASRETTHDYEGKEYVAQFVPRELIGARRTPLTIATLLAGPIFITGTPVAISGAGTDQSGGQARGMISLRLEDGRIFWFSALALIVILLIADMLIGDIYAMQKLLVMLVLVWLAYCFLIGMAAQYVIKDVAAELFPENLQLGLTPSGLLTAPLKIGFLGLIYWMSSMLIHNLKTGQAPRRKAA